MGFSSDPAVAIAKLDAFSKPALAVIVGVLPNAQKYPDGTSAASVAAEHELDPSSNYNKWLIKAINANESVQTTEMVRLLKLAGNKVGLRKRLMREFGDTVATNVQNAILHRQINLPPNTPATLALKAGSVPMVDTKHLIGVIDSKLVT